MLQLRTIGIIVGCLSTYYPHDINLKQKVSQKKILIHLRTINLTDNYIRLEWAIG